MSRESAKDKLHVTTSPVTAFVNGSEERMDSVQLVQSVLPWRQPNAEEVKTDCCTRTQVMCSAKLNGETEAASMQPTSEETDNEPNWISWLTDSCMQSTTSAVQKNLASNHCEQEYSMHHREIAYAHHKHCLQVHPHQQTCAPPTGYSLTSFATENEPDKLTPSGHSQEETSKAITHPGAPKESHDGPHFRDIYPHHHHRYHHGHNHGSQKLSSAPLDPFEDVDFPLGHIEPVVELPSLHLQGKLERLKGFHISSGLDTESEYEEAWYTLNMRVWEWLKGVHEAA